nr:unnamed protein product [Digitaria exilis]
MEDQQGQSDDSHVVNIPPLARELTEQLGNDHHLAVQTSEGSPPCSITIAQVRRLMRNVDEAMYDPDHVSIGPYHRIAMDSDKLTCLRTVRSAASTGTALDVYVEELERLEVQARRCYAHSLENITSREFVRMLLLDGCYLLVQFGEISGGESRNHVVEGAGLSNGHVTAGSRDGLEALAVVRDVLYLAENQIPFFILDKIIQITVSDTSAYAGDKIMLFVQALLKRHQYSVAPPPAMRPGNLLHLLHMHLKPTNPPSDNTGNVKLGRWRTANEYYFVGVSFKPRPLNAGDRVQSILDVNLRSGTLEIPPLNIDAETWRILHNLMALEQSNPEVAGSHVTAYCVFMSQVACTAADVDLLCSKGIMAHLLGNSGEVADRFAKLCKGIVFDLDDSHSNYLRATCEELEERFQSRVRRWMAWLGRKYFNNPWLFIGLMAAAVGLTCSVVQSPWPAASVQDRTLVVAAEKAGAKERPLEEAADEEEDGETWPAASFGRYRTRVELPENADVERITAEKKQWARFVQDKIKSCVALLVLSKLGLAGTGQSDSLAVAMEITSLEELMWAQLAGPQDLAMQQYTGTPPCPITIGEDGELLRNMEPRHVSIGPYKRLKKSGFLARDEEKIEILRSVLSATSTGATLRMCLDEMAVLVPIARSCYANRFDSISMQDFVRMLLLDALYVLVRFGRVQTGLGSNGHVPPGGDVQLTSQAAAAAGGGGGGGGERLEDVAVVHDVLYLAANQIPFFVVDKVHRLITPENGVSAAVRIAEYVRELLRTRYSVFEPNVTEAPGPGNLLHLVHMHFKPTAAMPPSSSTGEPVRRWRRATEYHFAGVEFKGRPIGRTNGARCILDVKLDRRGRTLEVPHLNIDAETWSLLRNLMALEQRNQDVTGSHVTAYCIFMSQVACTPEDVALLSRRGIVTHGLGNDVEVADFFADLCKGVVFTVNDPDRNYLRATCRELEKQFQSNWGRWAAWLRQKYFSNPWLAVGLAAAAVGLTCGVVQTIYSVLSYYKPGAH